MKKNILIVSPFFVPAYSYGGIVRVAYDQALGLTQHGYNVTAITTDVFDAKQRNKIRKEYINGIEVIRFKNVSNYLAKFQNLHLPIGMRRWLKKNIKNYDLVHIHDIYNLPTYRACKYARENKVIYFIQPHGTLSSISIESRKGSIKKYILSQMKTYFDNASGMFALTAIELNEIQKFTSNRNIYVLPNGIEISQFKDIKPIDIKQEFGLQYIKGLDISLGILAELNKKEKDWRFLIIGPDEGEKSKLIELSKKLKIYDKVIWYGEEATDKKYSLLQGSDCFLFNSRSEGFGMTIIEACMSKLPILISNNCPISDISKYHIGYILDNNNTTEFVERILEILKRKESFQKDLSQYIIDHYEMTTIIFKLIEYYEKDYSYS